MKKSTGKLLIGLAVGVLLAGGIGAIAYGSDGFTNSDISTWFDGDWRAIEIKDQTKDYTGTKLEPDIALPEGFTYEIVKIEKDGEEIPLETGAVDEGIYVFTINVTKGDETRQYFSNLTIAPVGGEVEIKEAKGIKVCKLGAQVLESGETVQEVSYTMTPADADPNIKVESILKNGVDASSYITASVDTSRKVITLTCKQAFDSQITINFVHSDNVNVKASLTCDYQKKLLSKNFTSDSSYVTVSKNKISFDVYKIYNGMSGTGTFTFTFTDDLNCDFDYSIGTIEYQKKSVSATVTESMGNNYGTSSALTTLYMSNGNSIGMKFENAFSFGVSGLKSIATGVASLGSGSYTVALADFVDETGGTNHFTLEFVSSGSFLDSFTLGDDNVIF